MGVTHTGKTIIKEARNMAEIATTTITPATTHVKKQSKRLSLPNDVSYGSRKPTFKCSSLGKTCVKRRDSNYLLLAGRLKYFHQAWEKLSFKIPFFQKKKKKQFRKGLEIK